MRKKNIRIEVWTDMLYARFVAKWYPEEESDYKAPEVDTRLPMQKNIPYLLVTTSVYLGRDEVIGATPVAPSQHPMPAEFLKQQIRHISYMFANEFGIFQPPSIGMSTSFLARMAVGFVKVKEIDIEVTPAQGSMTMKELRDSLANYSDAELEATKILVVGENPQDATAKGLEGYIHKVGDSPTEQYLTITKLAKVYEFNDPYIKNSNLPTRDEVGDNYEGLEKSPMAQSQMKRTKEAIAADDALIEKLRQIDQEKAPKTPSTPVVL